MRHLMILALLSGVPTFTTTACAEDGLAVIAALESQVGKIIASGEKSIVSIARIRSRPGDVPGLLQTEGAQGPEHPDFIPNDFGAGILIAGANGKKIVLTNYHVVRGGPVIAAAKSLDDDPASRAGTVRLFARFANQKHGYLRIIAADPRIDLAVLAVDADLVSDLPTLSPSKTDTLTKGRFVVLLGNPYAIARDGSASAGWGMISNIARRPVPLPWSPFDSATRRKETLHHLGTLLQIDARLNLGYSGGAVISMSGELVGITTSMAALDGYEKSSGFAIPLDATVRRAINDLSKGLEPEYGFIGIAPGEAVLARTPIAPSQHPFPTAAMVNTVVPNSPAQRAGLRVRDIVLTIDGQPIDGIAALMREVSRHAPAKAARETMTFSIWRPFVNQFLTLNVQPGKWPVRDDEGLIYSRRRYETWTGLHIDFTTARDRFLDQSSAPIPSGVRVLEVDKDSPLSKRLSPGDVITAIDGKTINTPHEFVRQLPESGIVRLTIADRETIALQKKSDSWTLVTP